MISRTLVAILAGGEGRRMGGGKPLRMLAGATLIERAVEQARTWSDMVVVCVREPGQAGAAGAEEVLDGSGEGPLAGLESALSHARTVGADVVLTIPCDMPLLPPDLRERLEAALEPGAGAVIAGSGGELHPVCAIWRSTMLDSLPSYRASGRSSLRGFAGHVGYAAIDWPRRPYDPFLNINRPEELEEAERLLETLRSR